MAKHKFNRLKGQIFYCAGPMDRVEDRGVEWRLDIKHFLWDELQAGVFDPCDKPIDWGVEDEKGRQWRHETLKAAADMYSRGLNYEADMLCEAVQTHMKPISASDFRLVDQSGAVILHVDKTIHMCGSYGEQTLACMQHKPVVVHCAQGKCEVPDWLWGVCHPEMFFSTWPDVKDYLRHVAFDDNVDHLRRWRFIDMDKVYGKHRENSFTKPCDAGVSL